MIGDNRVLATILTPTVTTVGGIESTNFSVAGTIWVNSKPEMVREFDTGRWVDSGNLEIECWDKPAIAIGYRLQLGTDLYNVTQVQALLDTGKVRIIAEHAS